MWDTLEVKRKDEIGNIWLGKILESDKGFKKFWKTLKIKEKADFIKQFNIKSINEEQAFENFWNNLTIKRSNAIIVDLLN